MGCDIHIVIEKRINGKWIGVCSSDHEPNDEMKISTRNYPVFSELALVRGEPESGYKERGLPEDISETAKYLAQDYGSDGHSHSWLSADEFIAAFDRAYAAQPMWTKWYREDCKAYDLFGIYEDNTKDTRLVFWFDN